MKDAFGGIFTLQLVVIFMIIVNTFLAFSVNYTKAFRAKNEIRSIIEKHEGLTCSAMKRIQETLAKEKYSINPNVSCPSGYIRAEDAGGTARFCYRVEKVDIAGTNKDDNKYKGSYYTIITYVNINLPIFDKIFAGYLGNIFKIKGETALIYSSGDDSEIAETGTIFTCSD